VGNHHVELEDLQGHGPEIKLEQIRGRRIVDVKGSPTEQVLVQWQDGEDEVVTWKDVKLMKEQFPKFHIEDKVDDIEGSIVRHLNQDHMGSSNFDREWRVYVRRKKN